jgi:hypothetical protein
MPDRVRPVSCVVSGPAPWVDVPADARHGPSGRVSSDPIGSGAGWVSVGFFRTVPRTAHWTQPIWPTIPHTRPAH